MASPRWYEVYNVRISRFPIDINGGLALFGVSAVLGVFRESRVQLSERVSKSVVFVRLHHRELEELPKGLQNVFQITQVVKNINQTRVELNPQVEAEGSVVLA
ncbi:jg2754 [Pararge aegeria aegeria]|uniref:Jg2754 protein n=1 Tax=Pararge aegeria aegeria TaxID=348720 RepID=A0A8S4RA14_9NEOP|nr:jg2754 [Pararge aegeria aegeria]